MLKGKGMRWVAMAAALLLLAGCARDGVQSPGEDPQSPPPARSDSPAGTDTEQPEDMPEDMQGTERPAVPALTGYRELDPYGPDRVVAFLSDFVPVELSGYPAQEAGLHYGDDVEAQVALYDFDGDGVEDVLLRYWIFAGYDYYLMLRGGDGGYAEVPIGGSQAEVVGILDTATGGLPDIAFGNNYYHLRWRFDGSGYVEEPGVRYVDSMVATNRVNWILEDGRLYIAYADIAIIPPLPAQTLSDPPPHPLPYYVGMDVDLLADLLVEPRLWCCDDDRALRAFGADWEYGVFTFIGAVKESVSEEDIAAICGDLPIWPTNVVFAVEEHG